MQPVQFYPWAPFLSGISKQLPCSRVQNICLAFAGPWPGSLSLTASSCWWSWNFISSTLAWSMHWGPYKQLHEEEERPWNSHFTGAEFVFLKRLHARSFKCPSKWPGFFSLSLKTQQHRPRLFTLYKEVWGKSEGIRWFLPPRIKSFIRRVDHAGLVCKAFCSK